MLLRYHALPSTGRVKLPLLLLSPPRPHPLSPPAPPLLCQVGVLIQHLRQAVSALLAAKVADPTLDLANQKVVQALHSLLATDGF